VYEKTVAFFSELMALLHPFMPFITEEVNSKLKEEKDDLCVRQLTRASSVEKQILIQGELLKQTISAIRDARNKNNIKPKDSIVLHLLTPDQESFSAIQPILQKQVNASQIQFTGEPVSNTIAVVVNANKFYIETKTELDTSAQKEQLQKELEYHRGFLISVEKKLGNERFVQNAKPEVVEVERRKKADAEQKIRALEESLAALN
jgi:valyl-tRNA synthetase